MLSAFIAPLSMTLSRAARGAVLLLVATAAMLFAPSRATEVDHEPAPLRLADTGLPADPAAADAGGRLVAFSPQYPLWSDGTEKRRWLHLPAGSAIDASNPDAWRFPPGTKLWKEFALHGRPIETRLIERRPDGAWRFAAYVWNEAGTEAVLAPPRGAMLAVAGAPNGRYRVPSRGDCLACHGGAPVPVLGASALQLSPDRDPLAPNARPAHPGDADLRRLVAAGMLQALPTHLLDRPPRIEAATPVERAALGYLHGNCAHCHNASGRQVPVRLNLALSVADPAGSRGEVLASAVESEARFRAHDAALPPPVLKPGRADDSLLALRLQALQPRERMPPLGTDVPDPEGIALVRRWIDHDLTPTKKEP